MFETLTGRVAPRVPLPRRADASVRMDRIMVLERRIAAMQAEQAGLVAEHATEWIEAGGERGVAAEVGLARGVSVAAAEHQLATALRLTARLPRLYELACRGEISWAGASAVCRETYEVEDDRILAEVDRRLAATVERGAAEWWPLPEGLGLIDQPRTCVEIVAGVPRVVRLPQLRPQPASPGRDDGPRRARPR